ncbi:ProQ/FINO family protein [Rickettsia fournieri]|uniref:ProQ/FINO family protein n=1 Tax=Rickettsia fournieri TaxID=1436798 RepID=UPI000CDEE037|nr:ProQ/FINO family protein [Rickettsia fournieri]
MNIFFVFFNYTCYPLISQQSLNGQFPNNQLNRFFHRYCGSFKYKEKLVEGARRFNLDGSPAALVTEKEVPVIVKKPKNVANAAKTVSNEIDPKQ